MEIVAPRVDSVMYKSRRMDKVLAHLHAAEGYAQLSRSNKLKVGAVLVKDDRIISVGYNGTCSGGDNACEDEQGNTKPDVIHAEENCVAFAAKNGISTDGCTMIITVGPCMKCARLLIQAGVKRVYYDKEAKEKHAEAKPFLMKHGVDIVQI